MEDLIYLYCVTNKMPNTKRGRDLVDNLYFIYHQELYAVVSIVSKAEFGEGPLRKNLANMEWLKAKASIHESIIEEIMEDACVVPFKLATLFNTVDSLEMCLQEHIEEFRNNFTNLEGREEWGVKIYADLERVRNSLSREDEEILRIDKEINSTSPGRAFLLKKKREEITNSMVNRGLNEHGKMCFERLREYGIRSCINKLLPREVTDREDEMILNSAFLVDKGSVKGFIKTVDALNGEYNDIGINLDCTGPWPPYNFCNLGSGISRKSEIASLRSQ